MSSSAGLTANSSRFSRLVPILGLVVVMTIALLAEAALSGSAGAVASSSAPVAESSSPTEGCINGFDGPTLSVKARGQTGDEVVAITITNADGATAEGEVDLVRRFDTFGFDVPSFAEPAHVRIEFTNDLYLGPHYDRNVQVDYVEICGQTVQTDDPTTESVGIWRSGEGCRQQRFGAGETLHCNGYFLYGANPEMPSEITVTVTARGTSGEEILDITNRGDAVRSINLTNRWQDYTFTVPASTRVSDLRFGFNNDKYIRGVIDRNMIVQALVFDGERFEAIDASTYVGGFWNNGRCNEGNLRTSIIHCDGWFIFDNAPHSE